MFTCERCGVNSADGFIMPDGAWLCKPCAMLTDNVDLNSLSAVAQAKTVQEKIDAWRNCNGIQASPKSNGSGDKTMPEKVKLVADFISAENVGPNERSEFALGLAVALLLQLTTLDQIQSALATIKGGYSKTDGGMRVDLALILAACSALQFINPVFGVTAVVVLAAIAALVVVWNSAFGRRFRLRLLAVRGLPSRLCRRWRDKEPWLRWPARLTP